MQRWSTDGANTSPLSTTNNNNSVKNNNINHSGQFVLQSHGSSESYSFHGAVSGAGALVGAPVRPSTAVPLPTMFSELQHEVSSLLEFKNALLETFPHLQSRMSSSNSALATSHLSGSTGELAGSSRRLSATTLDQHGLGGSTGQLNQQPQPRINLPRHVDVVSSDDTQPSWSGLHHTQVNSNGQASSSGVYSGPPGSNNVGSLGRSVMRRLHDSGFSPDASRGDHRWTDKPGTPPEHLHVVDANDELMHLLELIQVKSERIKSELDQDPSAGGGGSAGKSSKGLQAISEDEVSEVEQLRRERLLLLQRVAELESGSHNGSSQNSSSASRQIGQNASNSVHSGPKLEGSSHISAGTESESSISGIVHSVHIRTGQSELSGPQVMSSSATGLGTNIANMVASTTLGPAPIITNSSQISQNNLNSSLRRTTSRSISQSDLSHKSEPSNSVHIEIKNMSKSQDHLATANIGPGPIHQQSGRPLRSSSSSSRRSSIVSEGHQQMGHQASVSVVNLKHSSVDNLPQVAQTAASAGSGGQNIAGGGQGKPRYLSPNRQTFGQPTKSQILRPSSLLPGRMVMGIKARTTSNPKLKSHSVENLIQADPSNTVLGLKPANSEMNIMYGGRRRLSGTTSELNMTRIGTSEKVRVLETLEGVTSLPVELTRGIRGQVKPDRDKIRTILGMNNVIELQRHLLTTVMENEVYKTQLERVSDGWHLKMSSFERLNSSLRSSLSELQVENNDLKTMVNKKVSELDSTKARLRLLEQNVVNKDSNNMVGNSATASVKLVGKVVGNNSSGKSDQDSNSHKSQQASSASHSSGAQQQPNTTTNSNKSENHRVHFDLNNATSSAEIRKPARTSRPNGANVATRQNTVHLPSDARQKLEQLASAAGVTVVNPQPIRLGSPIRSSNLDPIQEMSAPSASKHHSKRPTSSLPLNGGMPVSSSVGGSVGMSGSVGQVNNNNNKNNGPVQRVRRESLGSAGGGGRSRPTTPSGRDVRALNLNNLSKSHPTVEMPTEQASPVDLMNSMDKKDSLVAEDLSRMGRDTIAELIAGIIQRNSINSEMIQQNRRPRQAFVDSETETEFTEVALSPKVEENSNSTSSSSRPSSRRQQALFQKRNRSPGGGASNNTSGGGSNQFHSLPHTNSIHRTSSNFGQVSSWEANNLMEEMTTHNSHKFIPATNMETPTTPTVKSTASNNSTLELDSLSARYPIVHEEDSLNFDLQEIDEEDSLTPDEHFYEHDSLQPVVKPILIQDNSSKGGLLKGDGGQQNQDQPKKLRVIPYNESFSSTTSIFTTSQDGSLDSCNKNVDEQTEEDSLTHSNPNLTLNMVPIKSWPTAHTVVSVSATSHPINHHPKIIGPEYQQPIPDSHRILYQQQQMIQQQVLQPPATIVKPVISLAQPTSAQAATMVVPQSNQSLVKMATERMKRKFLGWS